jgi:hypothetical protein
MTDPAASASPAPPRPGGELCPSAALARVLVALAAFVLTGVALRSVAIAPGGDVIGAKLDWWRAEGKRYDTVFVGSSHVLRAFVPETFDRELSAAGLEAHSYNFGVQAVHLLEARWLLERILEASDGHLRRVFFEYQWLTPQIDPANAFLPRTVYWHDWETTSLAVERALHWDRELAPGLGYVEVDPGSHSIFSVMDRCLPSGARAARGHLGHFASERVFLGRGEDAAKGLLGRGRARTARYAVRDGYVALEQDAAGLGAEPRSYLRRRERFLEQRERYLAEVAALEREPVVFGDGEWVDGALARVDDLELLRAIAHAVEERGIEFALVIMPSQSANRPFEERLERELGAAVLRYNLPERYPELYAPENRFDSGHLSAEGARLFSARLARDTAALEGRPVLEEAVQ